MVSSEPSRTSPRDVSHPPCRRFWSDFVKILSSILDKTRRMPHAGWGREYHAHLREYDAFIRRSVVKWAARCGAEMAEVIAAGRWVGDSKAFLRRWKDGETSNSFRFECVLFVSFHSDIITWTTQHVPLGSSVSLLAFRSELSSLVASLHTATLFA